jgi:methionyl-tRNA synthetase
MFLPDRFIKGGCPRLRGRGPVRRQLRGLRATYSPTDLVDPRSVVSGTPPVQRSSSTCFSAWASSRRA